MTLKSICFNPIRTLLGAVNVCRPGAPRVRRGRPHVYGKRPITCFVLVPMMGISYRAYVFRVVVLEDKLG